MAETVWREIASVHQVTMAHIAKLKVRLAAVRQGDHPAVALQAAVLLQEVAHQVAPLQAAPHPAVHLHQEVQIPAPPMFLVAVRANTHAMEAIIAITAIQIVPVQAPVPHLAVQHLVEAPHRAVPVLLRVAAAGK